MSQQKINFADYNAAGVYFPVFDNSIITGTSSQTALRVAVGFNMTGPFNRPVYVADSATIDNLFGRVDKKLERRGCFTNRNIRTMITKAPVYVMNLLNVNTSNSDSNPDKVGFALLSFVPSTSKDSSTFDAPYAFMYDRTKFWIADDESFVANTFLKASKEYNDSSTIKSLDEAAMFGVANCGTKDISLIIRKSELVSGYNVTFLDYYGSKDNIPYPWVNPNDYVSDYFVDVYLIAGDWGPDKYAALASDVVWKDYFTTEGLKKDKLNKFLNLDATVLLGQWTGNILPDFNDKQGVDKSIEYIINKSSNETGLMFGSNKKALDAVCVDGSTYFVDKNGTGVYESDEDPLAKFIPDMVGHTIGLDSSTSTFTILSCNCNGTGKIFSVSSIDSSVAIDSSAEFILDASNGEKVSVGDYVRAANGLMAKIVKKRGTRNNPNDETSPAVYKFTATDIILGSSKTATIEVHKSISSMYDTLRFFSLKGLKISNRHMPGFDSSGNIAAEDGVEKIYAMLEDIGIKRGLLNDNSIDFRQVVDTMAYGLRSECGGKVHLARLAAAKKHCTAFISAPSISQFAASDAPFFGDDWNDKEMERPTFNIKYIPEGGNQNMIYPENTEYFSLPSEGNGASFTGVFSCYLKYADGSRTILVPPAADVSNTYMNKFTGGNPYATVANTEGIISNPSVTGVEYEFDDEERGYFEKMGINPIINENGTIKIYGDRTAYQIVDSDLNFLHVRELLNTIQISCKAVLKDYVFKSNIPTTRAEITRRLNPILSPMKESGALVKYEIECDDFNNTKDVIDNKFCIVDIGVWISQNMEKIVVPITLNRSTTA